MHRLPVLKLSLLILAGCASAKPAGTSTPPPPPDTVEASPQRALDTRFAGTWYVSGVFPTAMQKASVGDPHLGGALFIDADEVSDINGQRCLTPVFGTDIVTPGDSAGDIVARLRADGPWGRLTVTCGGKAFATYLRLVDQGNDGPALLQQRPEGLYLLEQAAALQHRATREMALVQHQAITSAPTYYVPQAAMPTAKASSIKLALKKHEAQVEAANIAPAPLVEGPVEAAQPERAVKIAAKTAAKTAAKVSSDELPAAGTAIHLASYKGESAAKRGWKILLGEHDELDLLSPLYVSVDVPGQGEMIRLYATGAEPVEIAKICAALKAKKAYCELNPR